MPTQTKTDNGNFPAKIALRRLLLERYHADGASVFDCCQGSGKIWGRLRKEFASLKYWGVDVKRRTGRLQVDSVRVLSAGNWDWNVIDVDTYGSPWKHWAALLPHVKVPTTVFLTIGQVSPGGGNIDRTVLRAMGLEFERLQIPNALAVKVGRQALGWLLGKAREFGAEVTEAVEAGSSPHARYIGVHVVPRGKA